MTRLPWQAGIFASGPDGERGGGELQTDVMRFMAILAFCLVAIFALVQSIPSAPTRSPQPPEPTAFAPEIPPVREIMPVPPPPVARAPEPVPVQPPEPEPAGFPPEVVPEPLPEPMPAPAPVVQHEPPPRPAPVPEPDPEPVQEPDPEPLREPPVENPTVAETPAAETPAEAPPQPEPPPQVGFTLRFQSDDALRVLVESGDVNVYASVRDRTWRMAAKGGRVSFFPTGAPGRVHEMAPQTVPADVVRALRRQVAVIRPESVIGGVTLPTSTRRQMQDLMRRHVGGALIIQPDGVVNLDSHG